MNIIAVMGSPKGKGSGYRIVRMIEDRMKAMGDIEFAYLCVDDEYVDEAHGTRQHPMARGEEGGRRIGIPKYHGGTNI